MHLTLTIEYGVGVSHPVRIMFQKLLASHCFLVAWTYVLTKSHGQAEQGSYLVAHSCAARFVYLSASHFCSVKNGTLQFWNSILLYIGLYVAKFVFSLRLVPLPLVTNWRRKSVRR